MIPRLRSPIVLVHGLLGFGQVEVAGCTLVEYFPGIAAALRAAGNRVLVPGLSMTAGVEERARQLRAFILQHAPHDPVHVLAHSMGGLDARFMISRLDMAGHVLTLTTLGTPHRGTAFADWGVSRLERVVRPVLDFLGLPTQAFYDLTTEHCRQFNAAVPDVPTVRYFSVGAEHRGQFINPEWLLPYHIVLRSEGPNDGVVSLESARHGPEEMEVWEGDHLSLVNWLHPFAVNRGLDRDPTPRYARLLGRLKDLGY
jgi:triacylglycerol lipase